MEEEELSSIQISPKKETVWHTSSSNIVQRNLTESKEDEDIHPTPPTITTYPQRFWVIAVFSLVCWFQSCQWNTWGPINQSVMEGYGWDSSTVAMMGNWGTISVVLFVTPVCWLITRYGLRCGVLICSGLMAVGTILRCVTTDPTAFTILCHLSAISIGTAGTVILAAPPMVAAEWFPTKERLTATAVAMSANGLGGLGSYLEPVIVRAPGENVTPDQIRGDIRTLMLIWAGFGALLFIVIVIYFPSRPPTPPSLSSTQEKLHFKESVKKICSNKSMILILLSNSIGIGIPLIWPSVMNFSFNNLGINQDEAMWIGLLQTISCAITGILTGRVTDLVYGYIRGTIIFLFLAITGFFFWFFLLTIDTIPMTSWQVYVIVVLNMGIIQGTAVLLFEKAVEEAYPCSEIIVGGFLYVGNSLAGSLFLLMFKIPFPDYNWITYFLLCSSALSSIPLLFIKDGYNRSKIDRSDIF